MVKSRESLTIEVEPGSELAKALEVVDEKVLILVSNGRRYVIEREPVDRADDSDREAFREALRAAAGTFTPEEGERIKQDIYRWREEGTRSFDQQ